MEFSLAYAQAQETAHTKGCLREAFIFPQHQGQDALYFLGNSLGLPCVAAQTALQRVSDQWAAHGVEGFLISTALVGFRNSIRNNSVQGGCSK